MTTPVLIGLIFLVLAVVAYFVLRRASPPQPVRTLAKHHVAPPTPAELPAHSESGPTTAVGKWHSTLERSDAIVTPGPAIPMTRERPLPCELADFQFISSDDLPSSQRDALIEAMRQIPRPPRSLHRLLSPAFLASATSVEMSELVMSEPLVAAKVLSSVNSPLYGLQRPVANIGQAITFLGMNTVRGICVRYLLDESFIAPDAATRRTFEQLWTASAVASELCGRTAQHLQLPDAGSLVTQVVLYFVGHMAVATLPQHPDTPDLTSLSLDLAQRYTAQQQALHLCAPEIGRLLMTTWELPASVVRDVSNIDRVLNTPGLGLDGATAVRRALPYLCARLAERLAAGTLSDLAHWDIASDATPSSHHLQSYLSEKQQKALQVAFSSAETRTALLPLLA